MWNLKYKKRGGVQRCREQFVGCQRWIDVGKTSGGSQKLQTSGYKVSHKGVMYSVVTIVNNAVLYV